jgi:molybdate transport system ATP-binding protein
MAVLTFEARHLFPGGFELDAAFQTSAQVTAIFGPSGSGKTSIVETISGMRRCGHASIRIGDEIVCDTRSRIDLPPESRAVGAVFQDLLLFPHLDVARNLRYGMKIARAAGPEIPFDRLVSVLELEPLLRRPVRALSGGERQRVALGRALLSRPRLLVMDEPLGSLDERLKLRILGYLERALHEWSVPALFVSHAPAEVRRLAQWVVLIDRGRVAGAGPPESALAAPGVRALKNDSRPMNLLRVSRVRESAGRWRGDVGTQSLQLPELKSMPADEVFVEILPDSILLSREDIPGISARNHLRGVVREIVSAGGASFVGVDVGQVVWAELTPAAVSELELAKGASVFCLIKTQALRVIE